MTVSPTPQSVLNAFDAIDRLNDLAPIVLDNKERACWSGMQQNKTAQEIAEEMGVTDRYVRTLRVRVQNKLNAAAKDDREGAFRCAVVVQRGSVAMYQEDTTARSAIESATRAVQNRQIASLGDAA